MSLLRRQCFMVGTGEPSKIKNNWAGHMNVSLRYFPAISDVETSFDPGQSFVSRRIPTPESPALYIPAVHVLGVLLGVGAYSATKTLTVCAFLPDKYRSM